MTWTNCKMKFSWRKQRQKNSLERNRTRISNFFFKAYFMVFELSIAHKIFSKICYSLTSCHQICFKNIQINSTSKQEKKGCLDLCSLAQCLQYLFIIYANSQTFRMRNILRESLSKPLCIQKGKPDTKKLVYFYSISLDLRVIVRNTIFLVYHQGIKLNAIN